MRNQPSQPKRPSVIVLAVTYLAFISLGLPDSVLGVAWPSIRNELRLPLETLGVLTLVLTMVSAASSFLSGNLVKRFSTGPTIIVSSLVTGTALLGFSVAPSFLFLLLAAIPLGFGAGSVDSGLNAYVAENYSSKHMNWLHSFWGGGATLGPIVMTLALGTSSGWRGGYLWIALVQFTLAVLFLGSLPLWKKHDRQVREQQTQVQGSQGPLTLKSWGAKLAVALYVLYAAAELGSGLWANTVLVDGRQVPPALAGVWVSVFYGAIMGGRILIGFVADQVGNRRLVAWGLGLAAGGAGLFFLAGLPGVPVWLSPAGLALLGLGLAPVYPCLMHETPRRFTAEAAPVVIGWQVGAAYAGSAVLPGLIGWSMAHSTLELLGPVVAAVLVAMLFLTRKLNRLA